MLKHSNALDKPTAAHPANPDLLPIGPPVPGEVIEVKLALIRRAMMLGDKDRALIFCAQAFEECAREVNGPDTPLASLSIRTRVVNALACRGIHTVGHAVAVGMDRIAAIRGIGPAAAEEIGRVIENEKARIISAKNSHPNTPVYRS